MGYKINDIRLATIAIKVIRCLILLMLVSHFSVALASDRLDVSRSSKSFLLLTPYLSILEDASQQLTLEEIQQESLATRYKEDFPPNDAINFLFSSSAFWLRLNIENSSDLPIDKVIELNSPLLKNVDFYWQINQKIQQTIHTGYAQPFENRAYQSNIFAFPLRVPAQSQSILYLRIATPNAMYIEANLWEPLAFQKKELDSYAFQAFYFGVALIIFLFSLGLALFTKELNNFIYLAIIFFSAFTYLAYRGLGAEYIWPNVAWLTQKGVLIFGSYYFVSQLWFVCRILNIQRLIPRFNVIAQGLMALSFMVPVLVLFSFKWAIVANMLFLINTFYLAILIVIAVIKKQRNAVLLTFSFSVIFIGIIARELHVFGFLPSSFYILNSLQIGSLFELIVLTFFLTDRYRLIAQDKRLSDERLKESQYKLTAEIEAHRLTSSYQIALQASEEKLKTILELSPDGIGMSTLDGIITFVSAKTEAMWGYSKAEFIGLHVYQVLDISSHETLSNIIAELLKGHQLGIIEHDCVRKDGSHFICEVNCSLIYDIENKPVSVLYIQRDVTERFKVSKELELAKKTAEQANQAKSVFVSQMNHELRTPLNIVLGYAELLQDDDSLDANQLDFVQEILKGGQYLLELVNQRLDMASIESGQVVLSIHRENISSLIDECIRLASPLARKTAVSLRYQSKHEIVTNCDRIKLKQLLVNLISNAIKYNFKNGRVDISVELNDNDTYTIHVVDSGIGMTPEQLAKIFEPFMRLGVRADIEGTGLGLSICKELVELMGGSIGVKSELGVGSHFWLNLPLLIDNHDQIERPISSSSTHQLPETSRAYQVLYIDDNAINLELIQQMANTFSHVHLSTLQDPTQAINQALLQRPDIILLDINMPDMDGFEVLAALKADEQLKSIPVIALTANAMMDDVKRGLATGFSDYLSKPINRAQLKQRMDKVLGLTE